MFVVTTPNATSFGRRFFAYHHAMKHPHTNIILSLSNIHFVLKCAAKSLKIGLLIQNLRPKMFLNRDFCIEKLLAWEVTIFPEKEKQL